MKISILCSTPSHPVNKFLSQWKKKNKQNHEIEILNKKSDLKSGDILFLISCTEIIDKNVRINFKKTLVIHASDLPDGRGWSPHVWQIISGANLITLTLLEAEDSVDTGDIWKKSVITISKDLLWQEINNIIFSNELLLMDFAINNFETIIPLRQESASRCIKYLRRSPLDSQLDINKSISSQFDLIRVCEPDRYPAFFKIHGKKYKIILEKYKDEQ